jgi:hypothetical protein
LKQQREDRVTGRRCFLKKALYHTPVLYTLGHLVRPSPVHADGTGGPDGPPGGGSPFLIESNTQNSAPSAPKKRKTLRF